MLTPDQQQEFGRNGLLRLPGAVPAEDAQRMCDRVWEHLAAEFAITRDPVTWPLERPQGFQRLGRSGAFSALANHTVVSACAQLLGHVSWQETTTWGRPLITFPGADGEWTVPTAGWHIDGGTGPQPGITVFCYLDEVIARNGGTVVLAGSHRLIRRLMAASPDGPAQPLPSRVLKAKLAAKAPSLRSLLLPGTRPEIVPGDEILVDGVPVTLMELTGQPGDVIIMSTHTLHAVAPNAQRNPRMMLVQTFL